MLISIVSSLQQQLRQFMYWHGKLLGVLFPLFMAPDAGATEQNTSATNTVYYPGTPRREYYTDLLQLALSYPCQQSFQLEASNLDLPKKR